MREILFRAKRLDNGEWVEGYYLLDRDEVSYIFSGNYYTGGHYSCYSHQEILPSTLCQFTGLRDKDGNRIWEGDILTSTAYPFQDEGERNYDAEVVWFDDCVSFGYVLRLVNKDRRGISDGLDDTFDSDNGKTNFTRLGSIHDLDKNKLPNSKESETK